MKAWGRSLALGLLLSVALPTAAVLAAQSAEEVLLDKANYWRLKDRPDLALEALNKLLEINPNNPDALFQSGLLAVQQNKPADAQRYLAKLQQVAPDNPHIADLESAIRAGKIGTNDLGEARRLTQSGQTAEAVKKYREIFRGPPPSAYGVEYYMTLAGTPDGWDEARTGMEKLAQATPNDPQIKLGLAQLYTYREPTRVQGIDMLAQLSKDATVGAKATQSWRQALSWLGGSPIAKRALEKYLAQYPQDTEIAQLLADLAKQPAGGGSEAQNEAYANLKRGNVAAAERQFNADLRAHSDDAQALAGLGLVRLRQQRFVEARDLLARAMKAAPGQRKDLAAAYDSASFWARVNEAKGMAAARNYTGARAILLQLLSHPRSDNWGAEMVLGDVETKMGQSAAAEATYRRALQARPGNLDATAGLANALRAQSKTAELDQLTSQLSPAMRARLEQAASGGGGASEKLRNEAKAASANGDTALATAKFREAIAVDAKNPWIRLDYARFLAGQGDMPQAFATVDPAATGNTPTSILVSAMFDTQQDKWARALDKVRAIPPAQRSQDIQNFYERVYVRGTIDKAKAYAAAGNMAEARSMLIALYEDPNVKTDEKREAPHVLSNDFHDRDDALRITREVYTRGTGDTVKSGSDYAMMLLLAGRHDAEAAAVVTQIEASGKVNNDNREDLQTVKAYLAAKQADKLRERGDYAGAWDQISALLADRPNDAVLLLAGGRIFASAGRSKEALEYFDKAYQQDSSNIEVIKGVVQGTILAHDLDQAQAYLDKGMETDQQNPWLYFLKAQIAEARGNKAEAVEALRTARTLNRQKIAAETGVAPGGPGPTSLTPGASPQPLPPNPFRRSQSAAPLPRAAALAPTTRPAPATAAPVEIAAAAITLAPVLGQAEQQQEVS